MGDLKYQQGKGEVFRSKPFLSGHWVCCSRDHVILLYRDVFGRCKNSKSCFTLSSTIRIYNDFTLLMIKRKLSPIEYFLVDEFKWS